MTKLHEKAKVVTTTHISAVSYFVPENGWLPGSLRPHVLKGWHAYWRATAPSGATMSACVVGPYETREEALSALYQSHDETFAHGQKMKDKYDD